MQLDLDRDGRQDLVITNQKPATNPLGLYIIFGSKTLGLGGGYDVFLPTPTINPQVVYVADLLHTNGSATPDGTMDIFVLGTTDSTEVLVEVFIGLSANSFDPVGSIVIADVEIPTMLASAQVRAENPKDLIVTGLNTAFAVELPEEIDTSTLRDVKIRTIAISPLPIEPGTEIFEQGHRPFIRSSEANTDQVILPGARSIYWCNDNLNACDDLSITTNGELQAYISSYVDINDDNCSDFVGGAGTNVIGVILPCTSPQGDLAFGPYESEKRILSDGRNFMDGLLTTKLDENNQPDLVILDADGDPDSHIHIHWNLTWNNKDNTVVNDPFKDALFFLPAPTSQAAWIVVGDFMGDGTQELWTFESSGLASCWHYANETLVTCN